jgi:hypothetical protein
MSGKSTYVRKVDVGKYEYGFVERSRNFRKHADRYEAAGTANSVAEAEAARSMLSDGERANG